jgi:hypothetical protein
MWPLSVSTETARLAVRLLATPLQRAPDPSGQNDRLPAGVA